MRQYAHTNPGSLEYRAAIAHADGGPSNPRAIGFAKAGDDPAFRVTFDELVERFLGSGTSKNIAVKVAWAAMFKCGACGRWCRPDKDRDWQNLQRRPDGGLDHLDCGFTESIRKKTQRQLDNYQRTAARRATLRGERLA